MSINDTTSSVDTDCCEEDCENDATYYDSDNLGYCTSHSPQEEEDE